MSMAFSSKMLLACLVFVVWCSTSVLCVTYSEQSPCPTWMYRQSQQDKECTCGNDLHDAVSCHTGMYSVTVMPGFCFILSEDLNTTLI